MNRKRYHPVTQVVAWVGLSIFLPLIPVFCGIATYVLQSETINLFKLLDGIELFLVSLWLVTATAWELSKHDFHWERPARLALIALGAIDLICLVLIYVHSRIRSLDLDTETYLSLAIGHFLFIATVSVALQLYMCYADYGMVSEGEAS